MSGIKKSRVYSAWRGGFLTSVRVQNLNSSLRSAEILREAKRLADKQKKEHTALMKQLKQERISKLQNER